MNKRNQFDISWDDENTKTEEIKKVEDKKEDIVIKEKPKKIHIDITLTPELINEIREYQSEKLMQGKNLNRTKIIELALKEYLAKK